MNETIETFHSFYVKCDKLNNRTYVPRGDGARNKTTERPHVDSDYITRSAPAFQKLILNRAIFDESVLCVGGSRVQNNPIIINLISFINCFSIIM